MNLKWAEDGHGECWMIESYLLGCQGRFHWKCAEWRSEQGEGTSHKKSSIITMWCRKCQSKTISDDLWWHRAANYASDIEYWNIHSKSILFGYIKHCNSL